MDRRQPTQEKINKILELRGVGLPLYKIQKEAKTSAETVKRILKGAGMSVIFGKARKYTSDSHFFDEINSEEKAYWLGFLYADGCVTKGGVNLLLKWDDCEVEHLKKYKKSLASNSKIELRHEKIRDKEKNVIRIQHTAKVRINDHRLMEQLIDKGCVPRKTFILKFPNEKIVPSRLIRHFIRGYFDGDGSIWKLKDNKYQKWGLRILGTMSIAEGIKREFDALGVTSFINPHPSQGIFGVDVHSFLSLNKVKNYFYDDATIFLQRKYDKFQLLPFREYNSQKEEMLANIPKFIFLKKRVTSFEVAGHFKCRLGSAQNRLKDLKQAGVLKARRNADNILIYENRSHQNLKLSH